jgi:hypothetical protein
MLDHYLEEASNLEFSERNDEIPRLVAQEKAEMNSRGVLNSTMTLHALGDFFSSEFLYRCDFIKNFIITHSSLIETQGGNDVITVSKTLFQERSFSERETIKALYENSTQEIALSIYNEGMKSQLSSSLYERIEKRINKNNLYIEISFQELKAAKTHKNNVVILQPNISGIGVDISELWRRFVK